MPDASDHSGKPKDVPAVVTANATGVPQEIGARLKHARMARGLRLREVALKAGCSESMISKIENARITPSIRTFHSVCTALGVTMGEIMSQPGASSQKIWRTGERPVTELNSERLGSGIKLERLIPYTRGHLLQGNIHVIAPGGATDGVVTHMGEEVGYVLAGEIELVVGDETFLVREGDSFLYPSDIAHGYRNCGAVEARVIFINTPPTY